MQMSNRTTPKILFILITLLNFMVEIKSWTNALSSTRRRSPSILDTVDSSQLFDGNKLPELVNTNPRLISAPLGVCLDNQHGLFNALNYDAYNVNVQIGTHLILKTALWVPFLFGFAGVLMSGMILSLDPHFSTNPALTKPPWHKVLYGISAFSGQYYLSGALDYSLVDPLQSNLILSFIAVIGFLYFDGSRAGFVLALATAFIGPLVEIFLINVTHLYRYTHADIFGICSWIPAVYFLGGPAVGNLARKLGGEAMRGIDSNHNECN